jgi:hypothetical protein
LYIDFGIKKERQDCKIGTVCVVLVGWVGGLKEMKVKEYGWWAVYIYMK